MKDHSITVLRAEFSEELSKVSRKLRTLFDARVRVLGLTLPRARTLMFLAKNDRMTQTELADALEVEGPTLVRLLDGLEKLDLIRRCAVARDRRAKQIALTEAGRMQAAKVRCLADQVRQEVLANVPEQDLTIATAVLQTMAQKIEAASQRTAAA